MKWRNPRQAKNEGNNNKKKQQKQNNKQKHTHTNVAKQGLVKNRALAVENEGSRQDATRDVCSEPKRPARRLSTTRM